ALRFEPLGGEVADRAGELRTESEGELTPRLPILDHRAQSLDGRLFDLEVELTGARPGRRLEAVGDARILHLGRGAVDDEEPEAVAREAQLFPGPLAHAVSRDRPGAGRTVDVLDPGEALGSGR